MKFFHLHGEECAGEGKAKVAFFSTSSWDHRNRIGL